MTMHFMNKVNEVSFQTLSIGIIIKNDEQKGRIIVRHTKNTYEIGVLFGELNFGQSITGQYQLLENLSEYLQSASIEPWQDWHGDAKQWDAERESTLTTLNRLKFKDEMFTVVWGLS